MPADVVIVGGGPAGMACALAALAAHRSSTTPSIPTRSSAKKIFTCSRRRARSASTASPARCSIRAPCANCFRDSRRKRRSTPRSRKEAVYFLTAERQIQVSHHAAAAARSRQLRHLAQPVCEVAGRQGGRNRHHDLHRICRLGIAARRRSRHRRPHRRQGRRQAEPAEIEFRTGL